MYSKDAAGMASSIDPDTLFAQTYLSKHLGSL